MYYIYACKQCEAETDKSNLRRTPKQPALSTSGFVCSEAVPHIITQKFVMYSTLYRLEQDFHRHSLRPSQQAITNWILQASDTWLRLVYNTLYPNLCQETVLHGDKTTLQVLKELSRTSTPGLSPALRSTV